MVDSEGIGKPMSDLKSDPVLKVPQFHPCVEISVVLEAEAVDEVVDMIEKTLHTGSLSDGKFLSCRLKRPSESLLANEANRPSTERSTPLWADSTHSASKELSRLSEPLP